MRVSRRRPASAAKTRNWGGDDAIPADGADTISFEEAELKQLTAEDILQDPATSDMWLRSVQQNPADFLAIKFNMQLQTSRNPGGGATMNRVARVLRCQVLLLCLLVAPVMATTVEELHDAGRLQVRSWLEPPQDIVPGQQLKLNIEIATDRWFAGGTRLQIPEVPGLVILQSESFASNSSERRNGQSWVIQRWALELYPQREGRFDIPPISARIKVNDEGMTAVQGDIASPALEFRAATPESLARASHWVAAPQYSVQQTFDRETGGPATGRRHRAGNRVQSQRCDGNDVTGVQ